MSDDPARPPRFPYVAALLCAACLGAAAWTWMRFSYAWDVTPRQLLAEHGGWPRIVAWDDTSWYVRLSGLPGEGPWLNDGSGTFVKFHDAAVDDGQCIDVVFLDEDAVPASGTAQNVRGRLISYNWFQPVPQTSDAGNLLVVDATRGRFTGASIAGLVVGAMGVFVFTVTLRHWLRERRRSQERAAGA